MKIGMVLEGGGMRGLYTVGVLDTLMDKGFAPDYVIGVSAGAGNGVSFVSGQRGRAYRVDTAYLRDRRYLSLHNFVTTRSLFGMEFIFDDIPGKYDPLNYAAFLAAPMAFVTGVTDVRTGRPAYFGKQPTMAAQGRLLRASAAIPLFSPAVEFEGRLYLDGGTADPIPVRRALEDGCDRVLVVLTRDRAYVKPPAGHARTYARAFREYPAMAELIGRRHTLYNDTRAWLWQLEKEGRAVVIAPRDPLPIGRFTRSRRALDEAYALGRRDTLLAWDAIASLRA